MQAELEAELQATMATVATMVADPHRLNLAYCTGGEGADGGRAFYVPPT